MIYSSPNGAVQGERMVRYDESYYGFTNEGENHEDYQWHVIEGFRQPKGSKECGMYILNWSEVWDGKLEDYITKYVE